MNSTENLIRQYNYKQSKIINAKNEEQKIKAFEEKRIWLNKHDNFRKRFELTNYDMSLIRMEREYVIINKICKKLKSMDYQNKKEISKKENMQTDRNFSKL